MIGCFGFSRYKSILTYLESHIHCREDPAAGGKIAPTVKVVAGIDHVAGSVVV